LKKSLSLWQKELAQFLESQEFSQISDEPWTYTNGRLILIILSFVDDFVLINRKEYKQERDEFKSFVVAKYYQIVLTTTHQRMVELVVVYSALTPEGLCSCLCVLYVYKTGEDAVDPDNSSPLCANPY
jgi:hypothetical protein